MTPDDLKRLRELASRATPGPWREWGMNDNGEALVKHPTGDGGMLSIALVYSWDRRQENANFIAAASPSTVLALLDEIERLRAERERVFLALGVADDIEQGRDPIDAARSVVDFGRSSCDLMLKFEQQLAAMTAARDEACEIGRALVGIGLDLVNGRTPSMSTSEMVRTRAERIAELRKVGK